MNWEDTVMHIEDLCGNRLPRTYSEMKMNLDKQAEITWSIAEKAGIQKVVDWIEANKIVRTPFGDINNHAPEIMVIAPHSDWQAFLKEVERC